MDIVTLSKLFQDFGLGIALTIIGAFLLVMFVKFFLSQWDKILMRETDILKCAREERQQFQVTLDGYLSTLKEHSTDARNRYKSTDEAHRYQREEHIKMTETLNTMCANIKLGNQSLENAVEGFKISHTQRGKESEAILTSVAQLVKNCSATCQALVKINGNIGR